MSITKDVLHKKVKEIIPEKNLNPEVFSFICETQVIQPFLKWFVQNVSHHNVLTEDEIQISKQIKKSATWFTGMELDEELENALKDYPELEEGLDINFCNINRPIPEYEEEMEEYGKDMNYLQFLQDQYKKLNKLDDQLEEQIEKDDADIEQEQLEVGIIYKNCLKSLEAFDFACQEISESLKQLLNIYNDVSGKRNTYTWVQLPLDVFIKQLETYSNYLEIYIKNEFEEKFNFQNVEVNLSSPNKSENEQIYELSIFKEILSNAKYKEINSKVDMEAWQISTEFLKKLYSNRKLPEIPQSSAQFKLELPEMMRKRDFLEENIKLLREQLAEATDDFGKVELNQVLVKLAQDRIEYQEQLLSKLEILKTLTIENGHAYSDLLCLLMSSQRLLFTELYHFATDVHHYLKTEYSLAKERYNAMQKLQDEYKVLTSCRNEENVFNNIFLNILGLDFSTDIDKAIDTYGALMMENEEKKKDFIENKCVFITKKIEEGDKNMSKIYLEELDNGFTRSFQSKDIVFSSQLEEIIKKVKDCQSELMTMRNSLKETNRTINESPLEREYAILWQIFIANPNLLQSKYDNLKIKADQLHFKDNL